MTGPCYHGVIMTPVTQHTKTTVHTWVFCPLCLESQKKSSPAGSVVSQVSPGGPKDCCGPGGATGSMCSAFFRASGSTVPSYSPANLYQMGREVTHCRGETKHHQGMALLETDQQPGSEWGDSRVFLSLFLNKAKLIHCHEV